VLKATKDGLFDGNEMVASAAELRHAGFEPAQLNQPDKLERAKQVMERRRALPVAKQINYEDDGDVLWA